MKTIKENIRKMEQLQQQHARSLNHWMEQWWPSTNQNMTESLQETQFSARAPSNLGVELNLETKSAKQDHGTRCSLTKDQEISAPEAVRAEDEITGADEDRQIQYVSSVEESSPSKTGEDLSEISTTIDTSENSVCLNLESELGREDRKVLSPSTEKTNSEFKEDCEKRDYHGLDDNLGVRNLQLQPTFVQGSVGFKEFKFMVNAHKMFDEMPTRGVLVLVALFDEEIPMSKYVEFIPRTLPYDRDKLKHRMVAGIAVFDPGIDDRHECLSWDFAIFVVVYIEVETALDRRNWVFDPGKGIELLIHIELDETLVFLVSDPSGELFSLKCAEYEFP